MRLLLLCLCAAANISVVGGQPVLQSLDSLQKVLKANPNSDSTKALILVVKGSLASDTNPTIGLLLTNAGIKYADSIHYRKGVAIGYRQKGAIYFDQSNYLEALDYSQRALTISDSLKDENLSVSLYQNIGMIHVMIGENDTAIAYLIKFVESAKKNKNEISEALGSLNLGMAYIKNENLDKSWSLFSRSLALAEKQSFNQLSAYALCNLGTILSKQKQFKKAISYFDKSIVYATVTGDSKPLAESYNGLAECNLGLYLYQAAEKSAKEALLIAQKINQFQYQSESYHMLSDIYAHNKNFGSAYANYKNYIRIRDSTINDSIKVQFAKKQFYYERGRQNALHQAELAQKQARQDFWIILTVITGVAAAFLIILYKRKRDLELRRHEAEAKQQTAETDLKVSRLQMNPHFIHHGISSIQNFINTNDISKANLYTIKFGQAMRLILDHSLEKQISLSEELKALKLFIELEIQRIPNPITYSISIDEQIDPEITMVPSLIFQPFVENCLLHGLEHKQGGGHVMLQIKEEADMLVCTIDDDGVGRNTKSKTSESIDKPRSLGTLITEERIKQMWPEGKNAGVEYIDKSQGLTVKIKFPKISAF